MKLNEIQNPAVNNAMVFWHGGNLDASSGFHKKGRWEYGPGIYMTTHYGTAKKYAKGGKKFYRLTIEQGNDSNKTLISLKLASDFINSYAIVKKRKEIVEALAKQTNENGMLVADRLITMCVNYDALSSANASKLREFLVANGVDYTMVGNPFGWGEKMLVLYNMNKIINKEQIGPKDKIDSYDLATDF